MIRFSCPGCQALYTVGPDKAGKTGKCPKCQSQFTIPKLDGEGMGGPVPASAPAPVSAPAPKPVADPDEPVEIAGCPSCGTALTVAAQYLGMDVECPTCKNVFTAKMPRATKPSTATTNALARTETPAEDDVDDDRPSKKSKRRDDDEDDRPSKKKSKRIVAEDDEDDTPKKKSKRALAEVDDEDDGAPKKKKKGSDVESKRMIAALLGIFAGGWGIHKFYLGYTTAGIITILCCFGGFGLIGLIEGIIYMMKSDEEFIETYQIGEKQWF